MMFHRPRPAYAPRVHTGLVAVIAIALSVALWVLIFRLVLNVLS